MKGLGLGLGLIIDDGGFTAGPPPASNPILMEDNTNSILLEDNTNELLMEA